MRNSIGRAYFDKKIAEGKTRNEAMRCLKRRLANHIWRMMIADERRLAAINDGTEIAAWQTQRNPGIGDCSDVPWVWWTWFVGVGHAPEMKEIPRCHVHTHPSFAAASSI
jgi:hypothetical protein